MMYKKSPIFSLISIICVIKYVKYNFLQIVQGGINTYTYNERNYIIFSFIFFHLFKQLTYNILLIFSSGHTFMVPF